jgi:hypothetical protein
LSDALEFIGKDRMMRYKQLKLYDKFIEVYKDIIDYVFFIDLDEFVSFDDGYTMKDLIKQCDQRGSLLLPWRIFGACGLIHNDERKVINVFTEPVKNVRKSCCDYKSFVKLKGQKDLRYMKDHHTHVAAEPLCSFFPKKYSLNHYITKSWDEWCERIFKRGQVIKNFRKLDDFFVYNQDMIQMKNELYSLLKDYGYNNL